MTFMMRTRRLPQALLALFVTAALALPAAAAVCPPMESRSGMGEMVCPLMAAQACDMGGTAEPASPSPEMSRAVPDCCAVAELPPVQERTATAPAPPVSAEPAEATPEIHQIAAAMEPVGTEERSIRSSSTPLYTLHQAFLN